MPLSPPTAALAAKIAQAHFDSPVTSIHRFSTGLAHYVYDVTLANSRRIVVRIAHRPHFNGLDGAIYWYPYMRALEVPVPAVLAYDLTAPAPYLILDRLPGTDLGEVYPTLTTDQTNRLAIQIAAIQKRVMQLPQARGFGWLSSYEAPKFSLTWLDLLDSELNNIQHQLAKSQIFPPNLIDQVRAKLCHYEGDLVNMPPTPFLDDTTTKNVLIKNGALTGIVDVDCVCFGDPLYVLALTHMALLSRSWDTSYIHTWADAWQLTALQRRHLNVYTCIFCLGFMTEVGQAYNKDRPAPIDPAYVDRLQTVLSQLLVTV